MIINNLLIGKISKIRGICIHALALMLSLSMCITSCGKYNFLGNGGKSLLAETLPYVIIPDDPRNPGNKTKFDDLFNLAPGQFGSVKNYTGGIDSVGTSITDDFDGDAIPNEYETLNNIWVADYPLIEASIAPPVMMQIEVIEDETQTEETFTSEITSDDLESTVEKGSESVHRNEVNTRTVQFQDTFNNSGSINTATSMNMATSANVTIAGSGGGMSLSMGTNVSMAMSKAYGETKNKWKDVPFKDNLGRDSKSLKRAEAEKKSRNLRSEVRSKFTKTTHVKPNAGYVRAALYMKNYSVNMPVKLTNIRCTLMLETPVGELLPVQSFLLREDDYSLFKVDLYGGEMFGPYVIALTGLNTYEIKDAISKGCNPKIFIVGYDMSHVADSNYKTFLTSRFTGDNLAIIEENVKGRTAAIKLVGPGFRHFFRVAAFSALDSSGHPLPESRTEPQSAAVSYMSPGVSLEKALTRISYSGVEMEFADYVLDFTGIGNLQIPIDPNAPTPSYFETPCFHVRSVRSINGKKDTLPIRQIVTNPDGTKTYIMKPLNEMNIGEKVKCGLWAVFDQGRYYRHPEDFGKNPLLNGLNAGSTYTYFDEKLGKNVTVPKVQGITGCIWPGDHYDIVYISMKDLLGIPDSVMNELIGMDNTSITLEDVKTQTSTMGTDKKPFGYNPIDSADITMDFNTRWKSENLGERPFLPNANAQILGTAIAGDKIKLELQLNKTKYLNPSFGTATTVTGSSSMSLYNDFSYDMTMNQAIYPFGIEEALDFEISFCVDGRQGDWMNLVPARSPFIQPYWHSLTEENAIEYEWDYLDQNFTVSFTVPYGIPGVGEDQMVDIYLRTAPNTAYRESVWPLSYGQVKKFRGRVLTAYYDNSSARTTITTEYSSGAVAAGDLVHINSDSTTHQVVSASYSSETKQYTIVVNGEALAQIRDWAVVDLASPLTQPEMQLAVDNDFFSSWNSELPAYPVHMPLLTGNSNTGFTPVRNLGYQPDYVVGNWLGNNNYANPAWNKWSDAVSWGNFASQMFYPFLTSDIGYYMGFYSKTLPAVSDFLVGNTIVNTQQNPQIVISGNIALAVWESNSGSSFDIYARRFNATTGAALGTGDFIVNTVTANIQEDVKVAVSGDNALIIWKSSDSAQTSIRGRILNVQNQSFITGDIEISTNTLVNYIRPDVAISGNLALVVCNNTFNNNIIGRIINMTSGSMNATITCDSTSGTVSNPKIASYGNRALIVWQLGATADYDLRGRIYNFDTDSFSGSDFLVSTTGANAQQNAKLKVSGNKALVVWESNDTGLDYNIRGRIIDMTTGATQASQDFLVSSTTADDQSSPSVFISGDYAMIAWQSKDNLTDYDIRARKFNLVTGIFDGNDFRVNTTTANNQTTPVLTIAGDSVFVAWKSSNGSDTDIRGRLLRLKTGAGLRDDILVSSTSANNQLNPQMGVCGTMAFIVWESNTDIYGTVKSLDYQFTGTSLPHGLSNFFVSPMIERDYTLRVRIIDPISEE